MGNLWRGGCFRIRMFPRGNHQNLQDSSGKQKIRIERLPAPASGTLPFHCIIPVNMKKVPVSILIVSIIIALLSGGAIGFLLGIASTKAGAAFLAGLADEEAPAQTDAPIRLARERFELSYPENWTIDTADEDYDPDHMFSIESPGTAFVMFAFGEIETVPADSLQNQVDAFSKLMGTPEIQPFDSFGKIQGCGAILRGTILGQKCTVKAFACYAEGMTAIIVQQYPDEDIQYVQDGLALIEASFTLIPEAE